jgi:hypothetical protein
MNRFNHLTGYLYFMTDTVVDAYKHIISAVDLYQRKKIIKSGTDKVK